MKMGYNRFTSFTGLLKNAESFAQQILSKKMKDILLFILLPDAKQTFEIWEFAPHLTEHQLILV